MAASEPEWDPQPVVKKIRRYARRLDRTFGDLVELMEEIPRLTSKELRELAAGRRTLRVSDHLLAVLEGGVARLDRVIGGLRYGARKESFKHRQLGWRTESMTWDKVADLLLDAIDRLEALEMDSRPEGERTDEQG